jgi:hypothetical protein
MHASAAVTKLHNITHRDETSTTEELHQIKLLASAIGARDLASTVKKINYRCRTVVYRIYVQLYDVYAHGDKFQTRSEPQRILSLFVNHRYKYISLKFTLPVYDHLCHICQIRLACEQVGTRFNQGARRTAYRVCEYRRL